ncbi:MAG TPA: TetR/AcrR family transcriptional regulator [Streptosporangiaceae bacterium]|jgi:AcrR family transcriptional regulator
MSSDNPRRPRGGGRDRPGPGAWTGIELLWELDGQAEPAPRRGNALDREQIVRAAIAIADAEGLEAVTMRRVADRLNTGAMSLYRHVPDKEALVSMMIETVLGDAISAEELPRQGWRESLRAMAQATWRLSRRHRWYPEATIAQPPITPNGVAGLEYSLAVFDPYDLDIMTRMQYVGAVHHLALHAALDRSIEEQASNRLGVTEEEAIRRAAPVMEKVVASGRYPHVAEFLAAISQLEGDEEEWVLAGVELLLDGIEARLARLGRAPSPRTEASSAS